MHLEDTVRKTDKVRYNYQHYGVERNLCAMKRHQGENKVQLMLALEVYIKI